MACATADAEQRVFHSLSCARRAAHVNRPRKTMACPTRLFAPSKKAPKRCLTEEPDVGRKPDGKPEGLTVQDAKNNGFHSLSCARRAAHVNRPGIMVILFDALH